MNKLYTAITQIKYKEQWLFYFLLNLLFIWKYMSRTPYNPMMGMAAFLLLCTVSIKAYHLFFKGKERLSKYTIVVLFISACILIALLLYLIDPLTVRVDRWSATSYFLDGLFRGEYPYGIHTHVCETNYPSPSPLWFYLNIPFWLMGDVGFQLFFFLFNPYIDCLLVYRIIHTNITLSDTTAHITGLLVGSIGQKRWFQ